MKLSLATTLSFLTSTTLAHGGVTQYRINDKTYQGYIWSSPFSGQKDLIQRSWHQNPHTDPSSVNMTCNYHGSPVPGAFHAPLAAGSTVSATWSHDGFGWVHTVGPMMAYMASCGDDCTSITNIGDLSWFKIAEEGLRDGYSVGQDEGCGWDVVVPKTLKKGKYLLRHEIVNLELSPVQFYPNCAQVEVMGEGDQVPGEEYLVKFPGAYSTTDPGIAISGKVRQDKVTKNYTVPGPKVWVG
ncbi:glycoside hydrolase [Phaeosphaeria sp. MPI-PUGE-AT-0046c]|nr:glycoside hydrolase [Phaeosphaeria sp. MPI-PUGE-AT-0046c]